jgi:hypothetical protein
MSQKCVALWVSRILSTGCRGIFEDSKSDHGVAEEEQEVCLDRECAEAFRRLKELLTTTRY